MLIQLMYGVPTMTSSIDRPIFREDESSQIPALQLLQNLGYQYLNPEEAMSLRGGSARNVILDGILEQQLRNPKLNKILYKGEAFDFGDANISNAIHELKRIPFEGLMKTSEKIFELITLGKSYNVTIRGDRKSYDLKYIDWETPSNNVFHVTEEFIVEPASGTGERKRPDIVLFINGIPIVVIECKRTDYPDPVEEAVSQHIRNQKSERIPNLYVYSQVLLALCPTNTNAEKDRCLYATTGTPRSFWYPWKERTSFVDKLTKLVNTPLSKTAKDKLFGLRFEHVRKYFDDLEKYPRTITDQDQVLFGLCRKERLLEIIKEFILFDAGTKKIARYQQYFSVKHTLDRVTKATTGEVRPNGVIWHTQGSGKSLSMVMLAKAIVMDQRIKDPKVILITDRVDLDDQIYKTFRNCGVAVKQATSGQDLIDILHDTRSVVIATTLQKFDAVANARGEHFESPDIFILVDEAHRSQYGESNARIHKVFRKACFIGYTGTPLTKKERHTMERFGKIIGDPYTNRDAIDDGAIVPLLYEGRVVPQSINKDLVDRWFERLTQDLSDEQKADLKRKHNRADLLAKTDQRIFMIASDISEHFRKNWKGTGFKGQLAVDSIGSAMKYWEYFRQLNEIETAVVISKTDDRRGHESHLDDETGLEKYERLIRESYGDHKKYEKDIKVKFDSDEGPDILIVVWKLLTGFDVQRNTVLYIDKNLEGHTLLQATARVNRTFPKKDFGYIIDYHGNLEHFIKAVQHYDDLAKSERADDYDRLCQEETASAIHQIDDEINKLPQYYADLVGMFSSISNRLDLKAYEDVLWEKRDREKFYERLGRFGRTLHLALSSVDYQLKASESEIKKYKDELRFFERLKLNMKQVFAESIDYRDYEPKIQKLLNTHVLAQSIETVIEPVSIYDATFQNDLKDKDTGSQALTILNRTNKYISDNLDKDQVFYERFSKLIEETLQAYREKRISEKDLLNKATELRDKVLTRTGDELPKSLDDNDAAKAFFGVLKKCLSAKNDVTGQRQDVLAEMSLEIDAIIVENRIVDWTRNTYVQNIIKNAIEDYVIDVKMEHKLEIDFEVLDRILEEVVKAAKLHRAK